MQVIRGGALGGGGSCSTRTYTRLHKLTGVMNRTVSDLCQHDGTRHNQVARSGGILLLCEVVFAHTLSFSLFFIPNGKPTQLQTALPASLPPPEHFIKRPVRYRSSSSPFNFTRLTQLKPGGGNAAFFCFVQLYGVVAERCGWNKQEKSCTESKGRQTWLGVWRK